MSISGKFKLEKNSHFYEHLVALGVSEDKASIVDKLKPVLEISLDDNKLTLMTQNGEYTHKSDLLLNQEVDEALALDISLKSVAKILDANTIEIQSTGNSGAKGKRRFEFSQDNMVMTIENDSRSIPVAKRYYKRIED